MNLKGRVINEGDVQATAVVLESAFSWIGDFDAKTGALLVKGPLQGQSIAGKILVCTTGKGGTIAPFLAYEAKQGGHAPAAILCDVADPILIESALAIDIPLIDKVQPSPVKSIKTGQTVRIAKGAITVEG